MSASRFERDTAVRRLDEATYQAEINDGWWIVRGPNGGYLAAIMLRAFTETVADAERAPRSITLHFTAPPAEGPVRIETAVERTGRSLTTVTGRMWQEERLCVVALAAFSKPRTAPEFQDHAMPDVPPPDEAKPLAPIAAIASAGRIIGIRERYDQREVPSETLGPPGQAVTGGWTRLSDPSVADAALIVAMSDGWPPAIRHRILADGTPLPRGVPTVDLTVHFRRELPLAGARPDDFLLTVFQTRMSMEGFLEEDGEIWSRNGVLVAHSRQLGLLT